MHNLFVYGTLKRGYGSNRLLARAENLGTAISVGSYKLLSTGIPFLMETTDDHGARVRGELYRVSDEDLARCDRLEGHPHAYCREQRTFKLSDGTFVEAWVYLWPDKRHYNVHELLQPDKDGIVEWNGYGHG